MKQDWLKQLDELDVDSLCINTLRTLAIDMIQKADSGHPGAPMGCAPMAYLLWSKHMKHNPKDPHWFDRDRFVLSNGHGSSLLYSLLHLSGYAVSLDDLKNFRQWGSITPGHPENHLTPGVETTTGPLGQGFCNAVGFALAEANLAARYNKDGHTVIDHHTYAIVGDGCLMEGVTSEAASFAGHLGLGKLIVLYDDNGITIDGSTSLTFTEDVVQRFAAYGWHTLTVEDGNDLGALDAAISDAKARTNQPSLICVKTHIGYGSPNKQDTSSAHGSPLGVAEIELTKAFYGWPTDAQFLVPERASSHMKTSIARGTNKQASWERAFTAYTESYGELAAELQRRINGDLPENWDKSLPQFATDPKGMATRKASGTVLTALSAALPELMGGSADLAGSNLSYVKGAGDIGAHEYAGRNLFFGIREHGMGAICNGLALHGGFIPYGATFLVFSDYMRGSVRLGALEQAKVIWIWSHDSIGLGEDGPTHQPVEHLAALRAIPEFLVIRPADANETREAWKVAIEDPRPTALVLTRQNVPTLERQGCGAAEELARGAYVYKDFGPTPQVILIGTGSELELALAAARTLQEQGVSSRVVSMPCWELFDEQDAVYRESVLPRSITARVAVEAGCSMGWARYLGFDGRFVGLDRFGASAPAETLYEKFGITAAEVVEAAKAQL